eukprot:gene20306-22298_t
MKNKIQNLKVRKRNKHDASSESKKEIDNGVCMNGSKIQEKLDNFKEKPKDTERLGSLLKSLKIEWLKEICIREFNNLTTKRDKSSNEQVDNGRSYFSVKWAISLAVVLLLTFSTRLYQVEQPPHIW